MELLDEDGRLFGYVNVIDALVVLVIAAVLLAGVSLVTVGGKQVEQETNQIVVTSEPLPPSVAGAVSSGVNYSVSKEANPGTGEDGFGGTVTDIYVTPADGNNVRITALVEAPAGIVRIGEGLEISTESARMNVTVSGQFEQRSQLPTRQTYVTIETSVSQPVARSISTGDTYSVGNQSVAQIVAAKNLTTPGNAGRMRLLVRVDAFESDGTLQFAGKPLSLGRTLAFNSSEYSLRGEVISLGDQTLSSLVRETYVTVETTVSRSVARSISSGDTYRIRGRQVARIEGMQVIPTPGGENRRLRILLRIDAIDSDGSLQFAGKPVTLGRTLAFESSAYAFSSEIIKIGNQTLTPVESTYATIQTTVPREIAREVRAGDVTFDGNIEAARIAAIDTIPTRGDSRTFRVLLELKTIAGTAGPRYAGQPLTLGRSIRFETGRYAMGGNVVDIGNQSTGVSYQSKQVVVETNLPVEAARSLDVGDTYEVDGREVAQIQTLDTYAASGRDEMTVRMGLSLQMYNITDEPRYLGTPIREGVQIPFETDFGTTPSWTVLNVGTTETNVSRTQTTVLTSLSLPTSTADTIDVGDTFERRGQTLATVETLETFPTSDPGRQRVQLGLSLQAVHLREENITRYLGTTVERGARIRFETDEYAISPTITNVGTFTLPGNRTTVSTEMVVRNVRPTVADDIEAGMKIRRGGTVVARVTGVQTEQAAVVVRSESGNIYERSHPINKDLTLEVELYVRTTRSGLWYNGRPLEIGRSVILDFDVVTVNAEVSEIE